MNKEKMDKEMVKALIGNMKSALDTHSRICLELDATWDIWETVYNEEDLMNASLIFVHILWNISAWHCLNELWFTIEQASMLATELGENLRQTVLLGTWIDTFNIYKKDKITEK